MELNDDGTVRFDDLDVTLRRPTIGELWRFEDQIVAAYRAYEAEGRELADKVAAAGDPIPDDLAETVRAFRRQRFLEHFVGFYRAVFETLGNHGLPRSYDEWPTYFLGAELTRDLLDHWKMNPKASGEPAPG